MKKTLLILIVAAAGGLHAPAARATGYLENRYLENSVLYTLAWEYGIPMGGLRSTFGVGNSFQGVQAGVRIGIVPQLSAGIDLGWNELNGEGEAGHARFKAFSARPNAHYYLTRTALQPYVGLAAGLVYREAIQGSGPSQTYVGLCADPQVGVLWSFGDGIALNVAARLQLTTASFTINGDPGLGQVKNPSWIGLQIGLATY